MPSLPMELPASSDPTAWPHLHALIRLSPTLLTQLRLARAGNWTYHWNVGVGACCTPDQRRIDIDVAGGDGIAMQNLAHETSHAFDPTVVLANYPNECALLDAMMRKEAVAVVSQLLVREEIWRNGGIDIGVSVAYAPYYTAALDFYKRHHSYERLLAHVAAMYVWQTNSVEHTSYWQTYANCFRVSRGMPLLSISPVDIAAGQSQAWQRLDWEIRNG